MARLVDGQPEGDPSTSVKRVCELKNATTDSITFCSSDSQAKFLSSTNAGIVILPANQNWTYQGNQLIVDNARVAFGKVVSAMHSSVDQTPGIHPSAIIGDGASISEHACIESNVVIGRDSVISDGVIIGTGSVIGDDSTVGEGTVIEYHVTVYPKTKIGTNCHVLSNVVIGASGFSFEWDGKRWCEIQNVGRVVIGDDVSIGACTSIDRGSIGDTRIGDGVKIDNNVQIGHNCNIGDHTLIVANVGVAGSVTIGKRCIIAGHVGITHHSFIADDVTIQAGSMVCKSLRKTGVYGATLPVREARKWQKTMAKLNRLGSS